MKSMKLYSPKDIVKIFHMTFVLDRFKSIDELINMVELQPNRLTF